MATSLLTAAERDARFTAEARARKAAALQARIDRIVQGRRMVGQIELRVPDFAERAAHDRLDDE
jgi:hypothetical protein